MNKEDKLILGTLAGVDLVLSPEHYEEYKGTLNEQLEEKDKEIDRLNNIINELEKWLIEHIDEYRDMEQDAMFEFGLVLDKLKSLKENK